MKNAIILILIVVAYAYVSNQDFEDALLAHGQSASECGDDVKKPAPDTGARGGA